MAHPQLARIRLLYDYKCGYCGVSETDMGGELTVDHFVPQKAGGEDSVENLVYCCIRCNQYKSAYMPSQAAQSAGRYLLHPLYDDPTPHYTENEYTSELEPLTVTGQFHIILLQLNREALVAHRRKKSLATFSDTVQASLIRENTDLRLTVATYRHYTEFLEQRIKQLESNEEE